MATAFKLHETHCNLFLVPSTYSLAHAVSADLNTAKGTLAWQFAVIFGKSDELSQQHLESGNLAVLDYNSRFIYYLVTKENLHERSEYEQVEAALICLREHMRNHEITKVAMPRICCGNDRLEWQRIKRIIKQIFAHEYNVELLICEYTTTPVELSITPKCQIVEVTGNIFTAPAGYSLVHSVSADFALCAGIGLQFKCKFGGVQDLLRQQRHTGSVAVLKDKERFIYNLVTKERYHEKCTYPALYYALLAMREHMLQHSVTKLAVPRLGCGIDRLDWLRVKQLLELVFASDNVEIIAYFYAPPAMSTIKTSLVLCPKCKRTKRASCERETCSLRT